jgi:hypothetical protein
MLFHGLIQLRSIIKIRNLKGFYSDKDKFFRISWLFGHSILVLYSVKKRLTYLLAFSVLLIYSLTAFRAYMPYLNYQVNYKYISTVLCENKTKPVLKCHGRCHLQKELKKNAEEESGKNSKITVRIELEDMPIQSFDLSVNRTYFIKASSYGTVDEKIISLSSELNYPPPQAA